MTSPVTVADNLARCDQFIDAALRQPQNQPPCCRKGCSACCSESLYVSEAEVDHLLEPLSPVERAEVAGRLPAWLAATEAIRAVKMPDATAYRFLSVPCPLLKNNLCSVYARRPFGCRTFFATGDPENCELPARTHQKFMVIPNAIFEHMGPPAAVDGFVTLDHMGVILAERLLGGSYASASRKSAYVLNPA